MKMFLFLASAMAFSAMASDSDLLVRTVKNDNLRIAVGQEHSYKIVCQLGGDGPALIGRRYSAFAQIYKVPNVNAESLKSDEEIDFSKNVLISSKIYVDGTLDQAKAGYLKCQDELKVIYSASKAKHVELRVINAENFEIYSK